MHVGHVKVYTSGSEATQRHRSVTASEAHEHKLTLAMPIGEAASDIAGAILKLNSQVSAGIGCRSSSCCKARGEAYLCK